MPLEDLIKQIEATIPSDWTWLLRRDPQDPRLYFANILPGGTVRMIDGVVQPPHSTSSFKSRSTDPFSALSDSIELYRRSVAQ